MGNLRQKYTDEEWDEINAEIKRLENKRLIKIAKRKLENAKTKDSSTESR